MTPAQKAVLQDLLKDEEVAIRTIEYPASTGADSFRCLKVVYMIVVSEVSRTWVDWHDEDGEIADTREIVSLYNVPTFSERRAAAEQYAEGQKDTMAFRYDGYTVEYPER